MRRPPRLFVVPRSAELPLNMQKHRHNIKNTHLTRIYTANAHLNQMHTKAAKRKALGWLLTFVLLPKGFMFSICLLGTFGIVIATGHLTHDSFLFTA